MEKFLTHAQTLRQTDTLEEKGERALWSSVTSISHLVPYLQNLVCCLRDILHNQCQSKGKDSMGWLGQGQVCPCFYFGRSDDLFKPSNPRDFNNIHNIPASGGADSRPPVHVHAGVFYTFYHADAECARTCTSVGTVDISVCSCSLLFTTPCAAVWKIAPRDHWVSISCEPSQESTWRNNRPMWL